MLHVEIIKQSSDMAINMLHQLHALDYIYAPSAQNVTGAVIRQHSSPGKVSVLKVKNSDLIVTY